LDSFVIVDLYDFFSNIVNFEWSGGKNNSFWALSLLPNFAIDSGLLKANGIQIRGLEMVHQL